MVELVQKSRVMQDVQKYKVSTNELRKNSFFFLKLE